MPGDEVAVNHTVKWGSTWVLAAACSLYACDDSAVIPPEDDLGLGRIRDAYVPPILDASGEPVIPVLDAAASDPTPLSQALTAIGRRPRLWGAQGDFVSFGIA